MHIEDIIDPICLEWNRLGWAVQEQIQRILDNPTAEGMRELVEEGQLNPNALRAAEGFIQKCADFDVEGSIDLLEEIEKFFEEKGEEEN